MLMVRARGRSLTATDDGLSGQLVLATRSSLLPSITATDDGLSGQLVLATRSSLLPSITSPSVFQNDLR